MDVDDKSPDVKQIERTETTMRPSVVRADEPDSDFAIVLAEATWAAIQKHAHTRLDAEVGGVLLGKLCRDSRETPYLLIDGHVAALEAESRASNVTFTAETWTKIHESIDRDFPGASIVGWYHTHPSFGIFLSEMDVFIHRHFFEAPHQVAIVIDPVANSHGGFAWRAGIPQPQTLLIESSEVVPQPIDLQETFRRRLRERDERANALGRAAALLAPRKSFVKFAFWLVLFLIALAACCYALLNWTPLSSQAIDNRTRSARPSVVAQKAKVMSLIGTPTSLEAAACDLRFTVATRSGLIDPSSVNLLGMTVAATRREVWSCGLDVVVSRNQPDLIARCFASTLGMTK